jgi:adenine-specific DNA-methyltransferase
MPDLQDTLFQLVPEDGSAVGNQSLQEKFLSVAKGAGAADFEAAREALIAEGKLVKGKGRGGSVRRAAPVNGDDGFSLQPQEKPVELPFAQPKSAPRKPALKVADSGDEAQILSYRFGDKRKNNPHVGMVDTASDGVESETRWAYDPHIDPALQFDSQRAPVENLLDEALDGLSGHDQEILAWLDHALAGQDERAVREVVGNLRQRLASGVDSQPTRAALEQLKRMQAPYLNWTGKAERTSFEVDTVSLHVHERIDPATILAAVQKQIKVAKAKSGRGFQPELFSAPFENLPLRDAIDFYKHDRDWSNRLIAGDSLLVMNSLLQKESMAGQVQMIYIDPPYGIKYGSNFQPFVNKRDVKDRKDEDLTQEPEMIKAFRDTWELGIHSYLTYLRDRLLLAKELLHESGSVFVQISDENLHHVRELMDEIFGAENFQNQIVFQRSSGFETKYLSSLFDSLIWYSKSKPNAKYRQLFLEKATGAESYYDRIRLESGKIVAADSVSESETEGASFVFYQPIISSGESGNLSYKFYYRDNEYGCGTNRHWKTSLQGMSRLAKASRIHSSDNTLKYVRLHSDYPATELANIWSDTVGLIAKKYVVETNTKVVERCLLMTTDPGDLVLDPTCGSGTTAFVAEKWGRRWITTDTSRVAVTLAKQRLMTASYDYFELKYPNEGLRGGFIYKTVPHVTLKSIANNPDIDEIYARMHPEIEAALAELNKAARQALKEWEVPFDFPVGWPEVARKPFDAFHTARQGMQKQMDASIAAHAEQETLYDQPTASKTKLRITGPFTVEAVPFATVLGLDEAEQPASADVAVARSGETSRQGQWRDELLKAGVRGKGGQKLKLADLEPLPGAKYIHAVGTVAETGERVAVSFGPEHAALEQRQVEIAMREAGELFPLPKMLVFCAFTFDPEAAKDIDNIKGITALKVQMNTDLLTEDLKKARASNESFWLMGQPEVEVRKLKDGTYQVEVHGFDYFDTATGELKSGGKKNIAMWALDTDYDDRSLFPKQVFFPMAGAKEGWNKLKKDIRAELNEELLGQFHGTVSLPFEAVKENQRIAVKIVDDRGIESLKVMDLD